MLVPCNEAVSHNKAVFEIRKDELLGRMWWDRSLMKLCGVAHVSTVHQLAIVHPHVISGGIESFFNYWYIRLGASEPQTIPDHPVRSSGSLHEKTIPWHQRKNTSAKKTTSAKNLTAKGERNLFKHITQKVVKSWKLIFSNLHCFGFFGVVVFFVHFPRSTLPRKTNGWTPNIWWFDGFGKRWAPFTYLVHFFKGFPC